MADVVVDLRMLDAAGIGTYLRSLVPRLTSAAGAPEFTLLGNRESMEAQGLDRRPNVTLRSARSPIYSVAEQWELWRGIPPGAGAFWAPHYNFPLLHRGKLVVTVHDVLHLARPEFVSGVHRRLYARGMFAALRVRADAILCVSRFSADELVRHTGVDRRRIYVTYEGVDTRWFLEPQVTRVHQKPYFLFVGNVKPHKNLVRLVEAYASLAEEVPHDLLIVGKREGFITGDTTVGELASRLGGRVHFTGPVEAAHLRALYRHAAALVFPSVYEGFGLPPLEAMASGCPALVSSVSAMPEVCGDAALYFDPYDPSDIASKMQRLVQNPALADELRARGREHVLGFSWDRCSRETGEVIHHVRTG